MKSKINYAGTYDSARKQTLDTSQFVEVSGENEENHENLRLDIRSYSRDSKKDEAGTLDEFDGAFSEPCFYQPSLYLVISKL